jgi:3-oxoacyl-[acyl-carrier-protein] synthase-3
MHQATVKLLADLRQQMNIDESRFPLALKDCGNTVSSTIPILIDELRSSGRVRPGTRTLMAGFGVGFSWAGCVWTDTWQNKACQTADAAVNKNAENEAA